MSYAPRVFGSLYERFAPKYVVDPGTGCWNWTASVTKGYGQLGGSAGERVAAHRFSYEHHVGHVPTGHELHHTCGNRRCVNPDHLQPVTRLEHAALGSRATKTHCKRGHAPTSDNLVSGRRWRTCKTCHRERMREARRV